MKSSPEARIAKALWGKPEVMYDRRQTPSRRGSWRGGRRAADWPNEFSGDQKPQAGRKKKSSALH